MAELRLIAATSPSDPTLYNDYELDEYLQDWRRGGRTRLFFADLRGAATCRLGYVVEVRLHHPERPAGRHYGIAASPAPGSAR